MSERVRGRQKARGGAVLKKEEGDTAVKDEEKVKGDRSDEMMKPSMKQEDAARKDGERENTLRLKWEN